MCEATLFTTKTHIYATILQTIERQKVMLLPFWRQNQINQTAKVCANTAVPVQTAPKGKLVTFENQNPFTQIGKKCENKTVPDQTAPGVALGENSFPLREVPFWKGDQL